MNKEKYRFTIRELPCMVRMTKEAHETLKKLKRRKKASMAQIVIDLILKEWNTSQKTSD